MRIHLSLILAAAGSAVAQSPEMNVINAAAQAMGGKDRILSLKTLTIYGYGQQAYQNGGGNIVASPDAPQKWININGSVRAIDFEHNRMRLRQKMVQDFVFAYARNMNGDAHVDQGLDGDVAFNVAADGKAARANQDAVRTRRIEMLDNPVSILRAAYGPTSTLANLRKNGAREVLDLTTAKGDKVSVAFSADSHLPEWMSWVGPDANLGDVTYRTHFVGYQLEKGVRLPAGYNTIEDWRGIPWHKLYIDKYVVDGAIEDIGAPEAVRTAPLPAPRPLNIEAVPVARGVWYLRGGAGNSSLFEFDDHMILFEAYGNEASAKAVIAKARTVVPAKPLTEVIVSHHHFDHSGGLRAAVSEGLTVITQRGNVDLFRDMTSRPAKMFPDALGRNPKPIKIVPIDDKLVLKDKSMEVVLYRAINNSHMANGIFAYVPGAKIVAQGDLVDEGWDIVWWGNSYPDSVKFWGLEVEKDLAVHGSIHTYTEAIDFLRKQTKNAQELCDHVERSHLAMQGCPVSNTF